MTHLRTTMQIGRREIKNRFVLAPMTNTMSQADGKASKDDLHWLAACAKGGFGIVMTCATQVAPSGQGWPGQLAAYDLEHVAGLKELSSAIEDEGALSVVQLHHGGLRAPTRLTGAVPLSPVDIAQSEAFPDGGRALTEREIERIVQDFVNAAKHVHQAGWGGVEVHGAHGYLLAQFLDKNLNQRSDAFGGSFVSRALLTEKVVRGIREALPAEFIVGLRFSPNVTDAKDFEGASFSLPEALQLMQAAKSWGVDFLHASLWDCSLKTDETPVIAYLRAGAPEGIPLIVAGKVGSEESAKEALDFGADMVAIGKMALGNSDLPQKIFGSEPLARPPYSQAHLRSQGLGDAFIRYMQKWPEFVQEQDDIS